MDISEISMLIADNRKLLDVMRCIPHIEKTELARQINISFPTLSARLKDLEASQIIQSDMAVNPQSFLLCGISIGGAQSKVTLVDAAYHVLSWEKFDQICQKYKVFDDDGTYKPHNKSNENGYKYFDTPKEIAELKTCLAKILNDVIKIRECAEHDSSLPPIISIGIAVTGSIDPVNQIIIHSANVPYLTRQSLNTLIDIDIQHKLRQMGINIIIDHNAKALAVCEKYSLYQADGLNHIYSNKRNIACLYLGGGLGCGLILDNKLFRGTSNFSGEIGHIIVPKYDKTGYDELEKCMIDDIFGDMKDFRTSTSDQIEEHLERKDSETRTEKYRMLGYYIDWMVNCLTQLLNVDLVVFSGKMTCLMDHVWPYIQSNQNNKPQTICDRTKSQYKALAPTIGAAIMSNHGTNADIRWYTLD